MEPSLRARCASWDQIVASIYRFYGKETPELTPWAQYDLMMFFYLGGDVAHHHTEKEWYKILAKKITLQHRGSVLFLRYPGWEDRDCQDVACFDLDGTLIKISGKGIPSTTTVWDWFTPVTLEILRKFVHDGYRLIFFSNRKRMADKPLQKTLTRMYRELQMPFTFYGAHEDDQYRKPHTGMWRLCLEDWGKPQRAFYCGDAAGRPRDFSASDRYFASNCSIPFNTPEELFQHSHQTLPSDYFDVSEFLAPPQQSSVYRPRGHELIMLVGYPGLGKTHYAHRMKKHDSDLVVVSRDEYHSNQVRIFRAVNEALPNHTVVVDGLTPPKALEDHTVNSQKSWVYRYSSSGSIFRSK